MNKSNLPASLFQRFSIFAVWTWLSVFALLPLVLIFFISILEKDPENLFRLTTTLQNYIQLMDPLFFKIILLSTSLSITVTIICLLIAYPTAYFMAHLKGKQKNLLLLLMIIPFWTSSIIRVYAMLALLKTKGLLNHFLLSIGFIHHPLQMIYTNMAVLIGLCYNLIPFMLLPLYSNMEKLDHRLFEAARDLGASKFKIFKDILLPLTVPGIIGGILLVFLPSMTLFYIPDVLGGAKSILLGNLIENQFMVMHDWPGGCATSALLTIVMIGLIILYKKINRSGQASDLV